MDNITFESQDPVGFIETEFLKRKQKNSNYSLRSFACDLNITANQLSRIFNRQRAMTLQQASRVAAALNLDKSSADRLMKAIITNAPAKAKISKALRERVAREKTTQAKKMVTMTHYSVERFKAISIWYHLPLLELTYLKNFKSEPAWIAKQLGISTLEAKDAIQRLVDLGLLEKGKNGVLKKTIQHLFVQSKSEPEVRKYERAMLEKSFEFLDGRLELEQSMKLLNSVTFPVSRSLVPKIREEIFTFQKRILKLIQDQPYEEVYQMNCQLFPLTKSNKGERK